jgi:hypothetical protein
MAQRAWVIAAPAPFGAGPDRERWGAKKRGHHVTPRPGWDAEIAAERLAPGQAPVLLKVAVMQFLLRQKFYAIPELGRRLLGTGDATLIEGNTWHDNFWGRCTARTRGARTALASPPPASRATATTGSVVCRCRSAPSWRFCSRREPSRRAPRPRSARAASAARRRQHPTPAHHRPGRPPTTSTHGHGFLLTPEPATRASPR